MDPAVRKVRIPHILLSFCYLDEPFLKVCLVELLCAFPEEVFPELLSLQTKQVCGLTLFFHNIIKNLPSKVPSVTFIDACLARDQPLCTNEKKRSAHPTRTEPHPRPNLTLLAHVVRVQPPSPTVAGSPPHTSRP